MAAIPFVRLLPVQTSPAVAWALSAFWTARMSQDWQKRTFLPEKNCQFCRIAKTPIAPFMAIVVAPKPGFSPRAWSSAFGCKESILVLLQTDE